MVGKSMGLADLGREPRLARGCALADTLLPENPASSIPLSRKSLRGYGDLAERFKSAAPVVYDGSEAF